MAALRVSALAAVEADVEAGLALDLGAGLDADLAYGFDHNNAPGPGPVVAFLQPSDFVRRRGGPGFDAAVALLHCLVVADNRIGKAACYLFDEEKLGIVVQAALVALEGKDIVGVLVDDLRGDVALTAHGVDGHRRAVDGQQIQQLRESDDLVGFISHLGLAKHQVLTCAPRRDHVDGRFGAAFLIGAPQRLAVDGDDVRAAPGERCRPGDEAVLKLFGIKGCEDVTALIV